MAGVALVQDATMQGKVAIGAAFAVLVCLAGAGANANTFGLYTSEDLNYLGVTVNVAAVTNVVVVKITNDDPLPVDCTVTIDMGPDSGRRRVTVDAGESRTVSYPVRRQMTQRVRVHTECTGDLDDDQNSR